MVKKKKKSLLQGFPCGSVVKNLPINAGDTGSIPGLGGFHMLGNNSACVPQLWSLCPRAWDLNLVEPWAQLLSPVATATEAHAQ